MKVGLVIYDSLDIVSGGYLYDRKLVEYLESQGDRVEITSLPWNGYLSAVADNRSPGLRQRLERLQVDVLLEDELNHPSLAWLNQRLRGKMAIVSIVHHLRSSEQRPRWQNRLYGWIERRYLGSVDGFVFNSRTTREAASALLRSGVLERLPNVVAVPAGDRFRAQISPAEITARCNQEGPLRIIFLGNLIPRKGLQMLLTALGKTQRGTVELLVIGSPAVDLGYARKAQLRARQADLAGRVKFLGALNDIELAAILRQGQVMVVPSTYEGYGIVYLEGMSFGLPAIGGDGGATGEVIQHGIDGFVVPANDPQMLSDLLVQLNANRGRLAELSLAASQRCLVQPSWQETGKKIRDFLLELRR